MVDENAFWAAIDALDDGLASPPGYLPEKDVFAERLSVDGGPPPAFARAVAPVAQPFELSAALVAFISACLFAGAMSAAFVFHSPLERLLVR
jgi:hypothetical protein